MLWNSPKADGARRHGAVTAWVIVCLSVIVAIVALSMDGGRMMEERRHAQAIADAAALAAAADLYANWWTNHGKDPSDTAKKAATEIASANGSSPFSRASVASERFFGLNGRYRSSSRLGESAAKMPARKSSVSRP